MKMKRIGVLLVTIAAIAANTLPAYARLTNEVNFSVKAIIPENQIEKRQTYFDLRMQPGDTQDLQIQIFNNGDKPLHVRVAANSASTNPGGLIDYIRPDIRDESMKVAFSEIATVREKTITVPPASSSFATVFLAMPNESFDGIVLGGIVVTKIEDQSDTRAQQGALGVVNEFSYVVAAKLSMTDTPVEPEFHLKNVEPRLVNYKTAVVAVLRNSQPVLVKNMTISAQVFQGDATTPLHELSKSDIDVAPNSSFEFTMDWANSRLIPGDYRLLMSATYEDKEWNWEESFNISSETSETINDEAVALASNPTSISIYWVIGLCAVIVLLLVIIFTRSRKRGRSVGNDR